MGYRLGIDLGTTFSAAAIHRDGVTSIVELGTNKASIPSVVFIGADGDTVVGESADHLATTSPDRVARHYKRNFGSGTPQYIGAEAIHPDKATSMVLRSIIDTVTEREGESPEHVVLTHPADWSQHKLDDLHQAAQLSSLGRDNYSLVPEPVAAAMHYAGQERIEVGDRVAVYDLGGGTFDAAVVQRTHQGFSILGEPEGLERRGGVDFDDVVVQLVLQHLGTSLPQLDTTDPAVVTGLQRLRVDATRAKEVLSDAVTVPVPVSIPGFEPQIEITRSEFEGAIGTYVDDTITTMRGVLRNSDTEPDQLSSILLVGGSSRIPRIRELLGHEFECSIAADAHPKHAVALGAALPELTTASVDSDDAEPAVDDRPDTHPEYEAPDPYQQKRPKRPKPPRQASDGPSKVLTYATWGIAGVVAAVLLVVAISVLGGGDDNDPTADSTTTSSSAATVTTAAAVASSTSGAPQITSPGVDPNADYANRLKQEVADRDSAWLFLIGTPPSEYISLAVEREITGIDCASAIRRLESEYLGEDALSPINDAIADLPPAPEPAVDFKIYLTEYASLVGAMYGRCVEENAINFSTGEPSFDAWCQAMKLLITDLNVLSNPSPPEECNASLGLSDSE